MLSKLDHWQADQKNQWVDHSVGFGHLMLYNTTESLAEILPFFNPTSNCCITADARIDNRTALATKLHLNLEQTKNKADSWYILTAYEKWGEDCTQHLQGDFAFAIWDKNRQKLFCARDQIGIKPFYYYYKDGVFAFATEMKGILALYNIDKTKSDSWIADFIVNVRADPESSLYSHIHRLKAAHQLCLQHQSVNIKKYWRLDTKTKLKFPKESDYIEIFLELLNKAIKKRLRSNWEISSELSGGLDSSTVTAAAAKLLHENGKVLITISDVIPDPIPYQHPLLFDDRKMIIEVLNKSNLKEHYFVTGEEKTLLDSLKRAVKIHDEPPIKLVNIFADLIFEKTQALGSRVLLSGFGGDDIVSYQGYFFYPELFRTGSWRTLWKDIKLKCRRDQSSPYLKLLEAISSSFIYTTKYTYYKTKYFKKEIFRDTLQRMRRNCMRPEVAKKFDIEKRVLNHKLSNFKGRTMNEKIASRIERPGVLNNRLEYCNLSAAHNRVEYRYPLLDLELIQFFISIPSTEKIKLGWGRYFFRNASKDLIPEQIAWGDFKKSSSSPSFLWRMFRDKQLMLEALDAIPTESKVNEYVDVNNYKSIVKERANERDFNNYGGNRLFLLQQFLDRPEAYIRKIKQEKSKNQITHNDHIS
jgi:asparagine synthase (glutamine-hydrolysing)